jgi:uncharacterized protein
MSERFFFEVEGERLTALAYRAAKPIGATLLLGHGASGGQRDHFITDYAIGLAERGVLVVTYDFPFIEHGRRDPDRDELLQAACRAAVVAARQCRPKNLLVVGGKSLGGRVASEVVAAGGEEVEDVAGIVVLGYPLHPLGKPRVSRARHFDELRVPMLLVQGPRDPFGTPEELRPLLANLPQGSEIHAVDGGDHSFSIGKHGGLTQQEVHDGIQDEIARWISEIATLPRTARARTRPIASRGGAQVRPLRRPASSSEEGETMATKAESVHAEEQRHGPTAKAKKRAKAKKTRAGKLGASRERTRVASKATYAREVPTGGGRPSRKSTRSSANRVKPDANLNLREERQKGSPENLFRKSRARSARVRGSPPA